MLFRIYAEPRRVIHVLEENQTIIRDLTEQKGAVVKTSISTTPDNIAYPTPAVPEIKKELSLSDLFNIWTDCEVVTPDDAFVIVDKTTPTQFDNRFQSQSTVQRQSAQQQPIRQQPIQQQPQTKAPDAPIIHTLRDDEVYEPSYTNKSSVKEEDIFDMYVRNIEFEEKYTQPVVEKRTQPEFVSNKDGETPQPYNPNTSIGVQTRMFEEEEQKLSPIDAPISDVLNKRSSNLKTYNHTFGSAGQSRTTVGKDSAGEMQIRRNNSFLHDNVD